MWLSIIIFAIGFVGLVALFLCKALELHRAAVTPLYALRKNGDHLVTERWGRMKEEMRRRAARLFQTSCAACKSGAHEAGARFHAFLHSFSARLGEYLKRNGATGEKNGRASSYVKDMLEYKKTQINADNDADTRG